MYGNEPHNHLEKCSCGTPVVRRVNSRKLQFRKNQGRELKNVFVEYSGDSCKVTCNKCEETISFLTSKVELNLSYELAK